MIDLFCFKRWLVKKAQKDIIAVEWWNERAIQSLKEDGILIKFGIVPKGPKKGKECVWLTDNWKANYAKLKQEATSRFRFIITVLITLAGLLIAYIELLR